MDKEIRFPIQYTPVQRLLLHLLLWICIAVMYTVTYNRFDKVNAWVLLIKDLLAVTTIFYFVSYVIIPRWLMRGRFAFSALWIVVIYIWWGLLTYLACLFIKAYLIPNERLGMYVKIILDNGLTGLFNFIEFPFYLLDFIYLTSLPLGLKVMQSFARVRQQKTELELANVELELAFLKSQINPHFLFNTLNSIYILVSEGNPLGGEYLTKLSGIMNYLLHESNRPMVPLSAELTFLKNHIELERLRFNKNVKIDINIRSDSERYSVVPLIIFPFIENAFKHGPKSSYKNAWVTIQVIAHEGTLHMNVANGVSKTPKPVGYIGGIGIENVRKRLELNYKNSFQLNVNKKEDSYAVDLILQMEEWD